MSFSEKLNLNVTVVFQLFQSQTAVPVNAGAADWLSGVCKESELRILVAQALRPGIPFSGRSICCPSKVSFVMEFVQPVADMW